MLIENFIHSILAKDDYTMLFKVKDKMLLPNEITYVDFIRDFYTTYKKLPDPNTVESKFNISLGINTETPDYWYKEITEKFKEKLIEDGIKNSARNKKGAPTIFQDTLIALNTDNDVTVHSYDDGKNRVAEYNKRKLTGGITYLSTGNPEFDSFSNGFKRADLWTIGGAESAGKAEPLSNDILTPDRGLIKFGSLKVGDKIYGSDGKPQKVNAIYPQGKRPVYKISFADGTYSLCDGEHLWASENCQDRRKKRGFKVRTTLEIKKHIDEFPKTYYKIPNTPTIQFSKKKLLIPPYVMGAILGDGCTVGNDTTFTNGDLDVMDKVKSTWGLWATIRPTRVTDAPAIRLHQIDKHLRVYGLKQSNSYTKFIPEDYLNSNIEDRIELLRGLMDTDGYVSRGRVAEFAVRSERLALDVLKLVRQLGGIATYTNSKMIKGKPVHIVRASFTSENFINPFWTKRKAEQFKPRANNACYGKIIRSIEYSHEEECQCISVANKDKLYLTGEYGVVTHNTWLLLRMACWVDLYQIATGLDRTILIISGEMEAEELEERLDSIRCKISYNRLSKGQLTAQEERTYKRFMSGFKSNIKIVDTFDNLADIEHFTVIYQPSICFIDGSHLLSSSYEWTDIAKVTKTMKNMTRNKKFPIVNTTHLKADKGKTANGGNLDDFAYTKGYTRDSDIVGVMYASDMMTLNQQFGIDWVKVRRANRTQLIYQNDYENSTATLVSSATGQQLSLGQNKKDNRPPSDGSGNTRNGGQISEMYNP